MIVKCRELGLTNFKIALRQQFINIILIRKYTIPLIITLCCVSNAYYNWVYLRRCFKPVQNECSHSANTTPTHTLASICTQRAVQMLFVCDFCFIAFWNSNYLYLECKDWQLLHGPYMLYTCTDDNMWLHGCTYMLKRLWFCDLTKVIEMLSEPRNP